MKLERLMEVRRSVRAKLKWHPITLAASMSYVFFSLVCFILRAALTTFPLVIIPTLAKETNPSSETNPEIENMKEN